jgi:hypothetical protein
MRQFGAAGKNPVKRVQPNNGLLIDAHLNLHQLIIKYRRFVLNLRVNHRKHDSIFFEPGIRYAQIANHLGTSHLKILQVPPVINVPHLIRFTIPAPQRMTVGYDGWIVRKFKT